MPELILASTSPYRRSLLERLGIPFTVLPPQTPEDTIAGELPTDRALRLAVAKAQAIASRRTDAVVIHTACAVIAPQAGIRMVHIDTTSVFFRSLSEQEIERYVERERPFDCAGGFRAEGLGISLFESIESRDPTALIGLPLIWLACALRRCGIRLP
jgi:septum formation protein